MKRVRHGFAAWQGGIKDGRGAIPTESGALETYPYGFSSRFEGKPGTNPEELIGAPALEGLLRRSSAASYPCTR